MNALVIKLKKKKKQTCYRDLIRAMVRFVLGKIKFGKHEL